MAMINGDLKRVSNKDSIRIASQSDVCYLCAKKMAIEKKISLTEAYNNLMGHKEEEKILSIPRSGDDICICFDCLNRIYNKYIAPEKEIEALEKAEEKSALEAERAKLSEDLTNMVQNTPAEEAKIKSKKEAENDLDKIIAKANKKGSKK